jgi:hypothetical protein
MRRPDISRIRELEFVSRHSSGHRDAITLSEHCGCYCCQRTFPPSAITQWVEESERFPDGGTALCPHCGIDAVLPSAAITLRPELLAEMRLVYFDS